MTSTPNHRAANQTTAIDLRPEPEVLASAADSDATFCNIRSQAALGDRTVKYLDDPQSYFASLENEDTMKCVASSFMFLVIIAALLVVMFLYNPQM